MREARASVLRREQLNAAESWHSDFLPQDAVEQTAGHCLFPPLQNRAEPLAESWPVGSKPALPPRRDASPEAGIGLPHEATETRPLQVLLVEDSAADGCRLRDMLATSFQVTQVACVTEAVQRLTAQRFDVVLLALSGPESLGLDTVRALRAQPVVVLTDRDDAGLALDAIEAGAQDYLVKGQVDERLLLRVIRSVSARQRAAEALRQQQDWLRVVLSSLGEGVIATDAQGTITCISPMAARLTGWPEQEALGCHIDEVCSLRHAQTHERVENPVLRVLREGTPGASEDQAVLMARDGRESPIAYSAVPMRSDAGTLHGVVLVCRDISERKRLEAQLRQAQKMETIGTLAGGIAHDFNNMLAAMLGYTELAMSDVPATSPVQHYLRAVLTAGQRARDLVRQILAFSRHTETARYPVQLHLLIREALSLLRASLPSTIEIRHSLDEHAGAVMTEPVQMHQVLINLCANAEYAMRQTGGGVLEIVLEAVEVDAAALGGTLSLSPGPYVRLTVRDTGPGMTPEVLARIFEPFFTTKGPGEGTGIGLSVVHGIVTSHGGTIAVSSTPGQGTTFAVYLPRCNDARGHRSTPLAEPLPKGKGRILLVDDEVAVAQLGRQQLARLNYDVVACSSSREALELFHAAPHTFDLVITDQTMPQMSGDALARALRRIRPDIPIILCTGFSHTMNPEGAKALGIDAWLSKPWQAYELAHTVRAVLAQRRRQG